MARANRHYLPGNHIWHTLTLPLSPIGHPVPRSVGVFFLPKFPLFL